MNSQTPTKTGPSIPRQSRTPLAKSPLESTSALGPLLPRKHRTTTKRATDVDEFDPSTEQTKAKNKFPQAQESNAKYMKKNDGGDDIDRAKTASGANPLGLGVRWRFAMAWSKLCQFAAAVFQDAANILEYITKSIERELDMDTNCRDYYVTYLAVLKAYLEAVEAGDHSSWCRGRAESDRAGQR